MKTARGTTELRRNDDRTHCGTRGTPTIGSCLEWTCGASGLYYLAVHGFGSATGTFKLSVAAVPPADPCGGGDGVRLLLAGAVGPYQLVYTLEQTVFAGAKHCQWAVDCGCGTPVVAFTGLPQSDDVTLDLFFGPYAVGDPDTRLQTKRNASTLRYDLPLGTHTRYEAPPGEPVMVIRYSNPSGSPPASATHIIGFAAAVSCRDQPALTDDCIACPADTSFERSGGKSVCARCPTAAVCLGGAGAAATRTICPAGQTKDVAGLRCTACPAGRVRGAAGEDCATCKADQESNANGTACRCVNDFYNRSAHGFVHCAAGDHKTQTADTALPTCMPCHGLPCLNCDAEEPQILPGHARVQSGAASTIEVFRCPADSAGVVNSEFVCHGTAVASGFACAEGHHGPLCQVCNDRYYSARSNGHCKLCAEATSVSTGRLAVVGLIAAGIVLRLRVRGRRRTALAAAMGELSQQINPMSAPAGAAVAAWESIWGANEELPASPTERRRTREYWTLVQAAVQPVRILISFAQIVGQLGQVLHVEYPPLLTRAIGWLRPLLADVWGMLVHLDCIGPAFGSVYTKFVLYVFALPLCFLVVVALLYFWQRRRSPADAQAQLRSNLFVVVFLCYPTICNHTFGLFNCRQLSESLIVLSADYATECGTDRHQVFKIIAGLIIVGFAFGVPAGFTAAMVVQARKLDASGATKIAGTVAVQMDISKRKAADVIREVAIGKD
jgi:hypothetical protein